MLYTPLAWQPVLQMRCAGRSAGVVADSGDPASASGRPRHDRRALASAARTKVGGGAAPAGPCAGDGPRPAARHAAAVPGVSRPRRRAVGRHVPRPGNPGDATSLGRRRRCIANAAGWWRRTSTISSAAQQCYQAALKATPRDLAVLQSGRARLTRARETCFALIANRRDPARRPAATKSALSAGVLHDLALLEARHKGDLALGG